MDRHTIIAAAISGLNKTALGGEPAYTALIARMFDLSTHYDMEMKIELFSRTARLYTCERGVCVCEYRTEEPEEGVFFILDEVIRARAYRLTTERFRDESGRLHYGEDVRERCV